MLESQLLVPSNHKQLILNFHLYSNIFTTMKQSKNYCFTQNPYSCPLFYGGIIKKQWFQNWVLRISKITLIPK